MSSHLIAVIGELSADAIDSAVLKCSDTLIVSGMQKQHAIADYVCTNSTEDLDILMKQRSDNTTIVAPRNLYAKYVWEKGIECLPTFEDLREYQWNPNTCSQQLMSLLHDLFFKLRFVYLHGTGHKGQQTWCSGLGAN